MITTKKKKIKKTLGLYNINDYKPKKNEGYINRVHK